LVAAAVADQEAKEQSEPFVVEVVVDRAALTLS
jgi:hypothetical protein